MRVSFPAGLVLCTALLGACATPSHEEIQARFDAGLKSYDAGDYTSAYNTWHDIDEYDLAALRNVALMLRKGQGVEKDPKAALRMMLAAADLGLVTAMADAGEMIADGEAGPPDIPAAIVWLARAVEGGHPIAAFRLAKIYDEGTAVPRNLKEARRLYRIAADAGIADAARRLAELDAPAPAPAPPPAAQGPLPPVAH